MASVLTARDREILEALTRRVRVMTITQIARTWWVTSKHSDANARDRMAALEARGLITKQRALAHPEILVEEPLVRWAPFLPQPNFGKVSYQLQTRWTKPSVMATVISATSQAANQFGGHGGRPSRDVERTHDIHLAAVFLRYRAQSPSLLQHWVFEEQIRRERGHTNEMLPDVMLRDPASPRAVEFGGSYPKAKLEAFHAYCKEKRLHYEIW
jgi:hypothetical protein